MTSRRFQEILSQAIRDIEEHGFSDIGRMSEWLKRVRLAALMELTPVDQMRSTMADSLEAALKRATSKSAVLKMHPGIPLFTVDRIKPQLRAELDRRIMASANLIELNRDQAIDRTLQRLSGWASSVPAGGSRAVSLADVKRDIGKPLRQLSFEERRVAIDQSAKLVSSVNAVIAQQSGAIAGKWRSHWRQAGYDYRPDHKERDQRIYLIRGSWAHEQGLVKPGEAGYTDQITQAAEEPFCQCYYVYLRHLRDLPEDMLTAKGRQVLEETRIRK